MISVPRGCSPLPQTLSRHRRMHAADVLSNWDRNGTPVETQYGDSPTFQSTPSPARSRTSRTAPIASTLHAVA